MAKIINLLAASVGGGLVLGALVRIGGKMDAARAESAERPLASGAWNPSHLQACIDRNVDFALAAAESRIQAAIEQHVDSRLSRIEQQVHGQASAISELREFSMQTTMNMQKLLDGIDRLVTAQQSALLNNPPSSPTP